MSFIALPAEIVCLLVSLLDHNSRKKMSCLNKNLHQVCNSERLWHIKYQSEFGSSLVLPFLPQESYQTRYELTEALLPLQKEGERLLSELIQAVAIIKNHKEARSGLSNALLQERARCKACTISFYHQSKPIILVQSIKGSHLYHIGTDITLSLVWVEDLMTLYYDIVVMEGKRVSAPFFMNYNHSFDSYNTHTDVKRARLRNIDDAELYLRRAIASNYQCIDLFPINIVLTDKNKRYFKVERCVD